MPDPVIPITKSLKKKHPTWTKFLLPGGILLLLITGSLLVYGLSWKNPRDYIPQDSPTYLQVPSLNKLYDKLFNLEAADLALSGAAMAPLRTTLNELRDQNFSQDFFLSLFLDIKTDIILTNQGIPLVIMDLGLKSLLTRGYSLLSQVTPLAPLTNLHQDEKTYFHLKTAGDANLYFYFLDNLTFLSTDLSTLKTHTPQESSKQPSNFNLAPEVLQTLGAPSEALRTLVKTQDILQEWGGEHPILKRFLPSAASDEKSLVQLTLDNRKVHLNFSLKVSKPFLIPAQQQNIWTILPENTTYAYISCAQDLEVPPQDSLQKLIYDWSGLERGIFGLESDPDPIFFIEIKDLPKLKLVLENLAKETPQTETSHLKSPGPNQLQLPDELKNWLSPWNFPENDPFYVMDEKFLYLSPRIAPLVYLQDKSTTRLVDTPEFKVLQGNTLLITNFSSYYNLDRFTPFFMESKNLLTSVLRLYGRGLVLVNLQENKANISLKALKGRPALVRSVPNFPKSLGGKLNSPVYAHTFPSETFPKLIYLQDDGHLKIMNPLTGEIISTKQDPEALIIRGGSFEGVFLSLGNGNIALVDSSGENIKPFPIQTSFIPSFPPFFFNNQVMLGEKDGTSLVSVNQTGDISILPLGSAVLTRPQTRFSLWGFLSKGTPSKLNITNLRGAPLGGWPQPITMQTIFPPVFFKMGSNSAIALLSQKGELELWDTEGEKLLDKPLIFSGEYSREPKVLKLMDGRELLLLLNDEGLLQLFNPLTGKTEREISLQGVGSKTLVKIFDVNRDGSEEIFLYGETPFIQGLDDHLSPLPEFPLRGHTQPQFTDLDKDGFLELVTGGMDNKIYAYTLRF